MPKHKLEIEVANILLQKRKELGYTQEQIAEAAGLSPVQYSKMERGLTKIPVSVIGLVGDAIGIEFILSPHGAGRINNEPEMGAKCLVDYQGDKITGTVIMIRKETFDVELGGLSIEAINIPKSKFKRA